MKKKTTYTLSKEQYIEMLSLKTNEVHMTNGNSKTGSLVNDVAFPTVCCREDAPCKQSGQCYCMKGPQQISCVQAAYLRNLRLYRTDKKDFWEQLEFKLKHRPLPYFRFFDAGDYVCKEFVGEACEFAKKFPNIKFLAYTKHYEWVNEYLDDHELPDNFCIRFSAWHVGWKVPNPHNLPMAYVGFKDKTLNPEFPKPITFCNNQVDKSVTCGICQKCFDKTIPAVIFKQH